MSNYVWHTLAVLVVLVLGIALWGAKQFVEHGESRVILNVNDTLHKSFKIICTSQEGRTSIELISTWEARDYGPKRTGIISDPYSGASIKNNVVFGYKMDTDKFND